METPTEVSAKLGSRSA